MNKHAIRWRFTRNQWFKICVDRDHYTGFCGYNYAMYRNLPRKKKKSFRKRYIGLRHYAADRGFCVFSHELLLAPMPASMGELFAIGIVQNFDYDEPEPAPRFKFMRFRRLAAEDQHEYNRRRLNEIEEMECEEIKDKPMKLIEHKEKEHSSEFVYRPPYTVRFATAPVCNAYWVIEHTHEIDLRPSEEHDE